MAIHDQEPNVVVTITPEGTLRVALNERPEKRWSDYNRRFNALLMGRDRQLQPERTRRAGRFQSSSAPRVLLSP